MVTIELVTPPATEPITKTEVKSQLRTNIGTREDTDIDRFITTTRQLFEAQTGRALITQTWKLYLDSWPDKLYLPKPPLASVTHVKYYDADDVQQTLNSSLYWVNTKAQPGFIAWKSNTSLPELSERQPPIEVQFVCGASTVDVAIKQALLLTAGSYFENRTQFIQGDYLSEFPLGWQVLVNQYRVGTWGDWNEV